MKKWVAWSVEHSSVVLAGTLVLAILAIFLGRGLRFDALPDVTGKQVIVLTQAPGRTPEEVERLVTKPIEMALGGVPAIAERRSISRYGLSSITAVFNDGADILRARQLVQERISGIASSLPEDVEAPTLGPLTGGLGEIYQFTLSSKNKSSVELGELVKTRVAPLLSSVPGIVEVNTWGGGQRTLDISASSSTLNRYGIELKDLRSAVTESVGQSAGATLSEGKRGFFLRAGYLPRLPEKLGEAVIQAPRDDTRLRLKDIAQLTEGTQPRIGTATTQGTGETVFVMVQMLSQANALEVLSELYPRMNDVRAALPDDVVVDVVYDRGKLVKATLKTVAFNLGEGGLLVSLIIFLVLGNFRASLIVASVIPLSLLGAAIAMNALDVPGNLMSLGALDFGLLVDGAVVIVEGVFHQCQTKNSTIEKELKPAASNMARPVFFSVLIIALVYVPILTLQGVEGKMFRPMATTVVFALFSSMVLSLTYVPAACRRFLRNQDIPQQESLAIRLIHPIYEKALQTSMGAPRIVAVVTAALLGSGVWIASQLGTSFVPQLDEGDLVIQTTRSADINLETATLESNRMESSILKIPEVKTIASRIGSPAVATDVMGIEQADVFVGLNDPSKWRRGLTKLDLIGQIEAAIKGTDSLEDLAITQPIQMRFNELVGGSVTDVSISVFGDNLSEIRRTSEKLEHILSQVPGATDAKLMSAPAVELIEVIPRPLAASIHGVTHQDIFDHVRAVRVGLHAATSYDDAIRIPVRVLLADPTTPDSLSSLILPTHDGRVLTLGQVATIRRIKSPSVIFHDNAQRREIVGFNVRGRDLGSVVEDAKSRIETNLRLGDGQRLEWGGQYKNLERARGRMLIIFPSVLAAIFALLFALFRRIGPALLILTNVPFATIGGVAAMWLRGLPISMSAGVGFIALSGIAVLNGVVLVNALLELRETEVSTFQAASQAALSRIRPVLMTASVATLGFVPMMLATGAGAEVQRPLATVVAGGLVTSTLLTLLILPSLYPHLSRWFEPKKSSTLD